MDYKPDPNTNIGKIYKYIPFDRKISSKQLKARLLKKTDVPVDSIFVHTRFLAKKGLIEILKEDGEKLFTRTDPDKRSNQLALTNMEPDKLERKNWGKRQQATLNYCKEHVGKRIKSSDVVEIVGHTSGVRDQLTRLRKAGIIQYIQGTSPYEYLVLPEIKTIDKIPTNKQLKNGLVSPSVVKPQTQTAEVNGSQNIANMTMGEILEDYMRLKVENERLREGLQRMGMEFLQLGILEHD